MAAEIEEYRKTYEQVSLLLEAMNQIIAGNITDSVKMENFSGFWLKLAAGTEAIRQLVYDFYCELQVTYAQVASSKQQINETIELVNDLAVALGDLRNDAALMEKDIQGLNDSLNSGQSTIEKSGAVVEMLKTSSGEINQIMLNANNRLDTLIPYIGQTDNILAQIDNINSNVKLLSFNTAIEAARAGIHGRGFNVVAQEMRRLSEQSYESVEKTGEITGQMKREIERLVSTMNSSQEQVNTTFTRVYREVEDNLQTQQQTVSQILNDIAGNKTRIEIYSRQLNQQLSLWAQALDSLKNSAALFERIEQALTATLATVAQSESGKKSIDDDYLSWMLEQMNELVHQEVIQHMKPVDHQVILSSFLEQQRGTIEAIYTTDAEGNFIFSKPSAGLANARVRPWWQEAITGRIYKSPLYISAITRKPCLTIALPIPGSDGRESGVLGVDLVAQG